MNYTRPNQHHQDTPDDWLKSMLVLARALGLVLEKNTGVVVELKGDAKGMFEVDKVLLFNSGTQIVADDSIDQSLDEGTIVNVLEEE